MRLLNYQVCDDSAPSYTKVDYQPYKGEVKVCFSDESFYRKVRDFSANINCSSRDAFSGMVCRDFTMLRNIIHSF